MYIRGMYAQIRSRRDHVTITATPTCGIHPASNKTLRQRVTHNCASILNSIAKTTSCSHYFHMVDPYITIH